MSNKLMPQEQYEKLVEECLCAIKTNHIVFKNYIPAFVGVSRSTLHKFGILYDERILTALKDLRILVKLNSIQKWVKSDNATLNIAAFRLMATPEELEKLTLNHQKNTGAIEHDHRHEHTVSFSDLMAECRRIRHETRKQ
ncbi:MAG: hypothetical protein U9P90_02100 [Patescibacteria group bacterium]|nr:hypothetical protein [Patescibacteria group bacterium]